MKFCNYCTIITLLLGNTARNMVRIHYSTRKPLNSFNRVRIAEANTKFVDFSVRDLNRNHVAHVLIYLKENIDQYVVTNNVPQISRNGRNSK